MLRFVRPSLVTWRSSLALTSPPVALGFPRIAGDPLSGDQPIADDRPIMELMFDRSRLARLCRL